MENKERKEIVKELLNEKTNREEQELQEIRRPEEEEIWDREAFPEEELSWDEEELSEEDMSWDEEELSEEELSWDEEEFQEIEDIWREEDTEEQTGPAEEAGPQDSPRKGSKKRRGVLAKLRHAVMIVLLGVVVSISLCAVTFLVLQIMGKNSLYSKADSGQLVRTLSEVSVTLGGTVEEEEGEDWQEGDVRYNGVHYRYNQDILTFLFMGIDKLTEVDEETDDRQYGGQSDAIFLLVLNPHSKKMTVIGIPRDTMTEVDIYSKGGSHLGTSKLQLTLQHSYGDGKEESCERSRTAVSRLFYGLPIHGYCAINMGAIPLINDAVGGIRLNALETMDYGELRVKEGEELHLEGMDAYYYLHNRDTKSFNSAGRRLQRQKQYLTAYASAAIEAVKKDITFPVALYNTLSKYMVTDISVDEVSYLATQVLGYGFGEEDMHSLAGVTVRGDEYEEFYVDEKGLYELILKVFYEEIN